MIPIALFKKFLCKQFIANVAVSNIARIPFLITNNVLYTIMANYGKVEQICISQLTIPLTEGCICF